MSRQIDIKALVSHVVKGDGADKCRICMGDTSEGQVYLGDTVMVDGNKAVTLAELLETITGVQLIDESMIPGGVCAHCTSAAIAAQELCNMVTSSHYMWTKTVTGLNTINYIETSQPNLKSLCAVIKPKDFSVRILEDHVGGDKNTVLNRVSHKTVRKNTDRKPRTVRVGPACECTDCGKKFLSPYYLNLHLKNSGQKDSCLICGIVTIRGQDMKEHLVSVHNEIVVPCGQCPSLFKTELELKAHKRTAHKAGAMTCGDCGRTFNRTGSFEAHSQMHAIRTCRSCGIQFTNRGCYREHRSQCEPGAKPDTHLLSRSKRSNVRDPAIFICDYCSKTYMSRPQLKNHIMWIHMDVRPHQCQWCGKRFYTSARLSEHTVVHTRERNFECDICGFKLVSKMAAVYHRRRHTGERPYVCEDCGEKFISASRRSEHAKRRHGKGNKCVCRECGASYVRSIELKKHVDKAHSRNPLVMFL